MRKLVAAINMTIDGYCDHTAVVADEELHDHYTQLLRNAGTIIYGRKTYQLMEEYWPNLVKNPAGNNAMDEFAVAIDKIPKIVFSHTLQQLNWDSARLAMRDIKEEVMELKEQPGRNILAGSPSMITALTNLSLVDEYQLCVHPVIAGNGLALFKDIKDRVSLKLLKSKSLRSGALVLYYTPSGG